jgi:CelD/BcsL family acetyltransferase involved in cellulose biosynthesis
MPVAGMSRSATGFAESAPASTDQLDVACITTLEGLHGLRSAWQRLEQADGRNTTAFQSYDWCAAWADAFVPSSAKIELCIVTLQHLGEPVCILPGMICIENGPRIFRALSQPYAQYSDILCHPNWRTPAVLDALHDALKTMASIDVIYLRHVREDSFAHQFATRHMQPTGYSEAAPAMELSAFASEQDYLARYTKVQRRRRKKIANAIEKLGPLSFTSHTRSETFDNLLDNIIGHKQSWIAERGLYSTPLNDARLLTFLRLLSRREAPRLVPVITSLTAGGRPVSHELGLRYRGRHCAFITGHDPELTNLSPARLHMDRSQRQALADGVSTFDLMVPGDPYKSSWSCRSVAVADHASPLTARGKLHCATYIRLLRPIARKLYLHTPAALRQRAMSLLQALGAK